MPVSVRAFSEPEQLAAAICPSNVEILPLSAGRFIGRMTFVTLPRVWVRRLYANLPRIAHVAYAPGRAFISFMPDQRCPPVSISGIELGPDVVMRHGLESASHQRSSGPTHSASISMALPDIDVLGSGIGGCGIMPSRTSFIVKPPTASLARLKKLHAAVTAAAENDAGILEHPETAYGIEQSLIEAVVDCLTCTDGQVETPAQYRHAVTMKRFRDLLATNVGKPLYVPEVCVQLAVSHRALSYCCQEHLGMGPKRYFLLRRLCLARRALRDACPGTTVTEIAMSYGFWEFGRFAGRYREMFGETPSATIRNRRDAGARRKRQMDCAVPAPSADHLPHSRGLTAGLVQRGKASSPQSL